PAALAAAGPGPGGRDGSVEVPGETARPALRLGRRVRRRAGPLPAGGTDPYAAPALQAPPSGPVSPGPGRGRPRPGGLRPLLVENPATRDAVAATGAAGRPDRRERSAAGGVPLGGRPGRRRHRQDRGGTALHRRPHRRRDVLARTPEERPGAAVP